MKSLKPFLLSLLLLADLGGCSDDRDRDVVYVQEREPRRTTVIERRIEPQPEPRRVTVVERGPRHGSNVVIVREAPPERIREIPPRAAHANEIWVEGHWRHDGKRYVWTAGRYEPARARQTFVQPRWERVDGGYRFVDGHWRPR